MFFKFAAATPWLAFNLDTEIGAQWVSEKKVRTWNKSWRALSRWLRSRNQSWILDPESQSQSHSHSQTSKHLATA